MPNAPSGGAVVPLHPQEYAVSRRFQSLSDRLDIEFANCFAQECQL
ncbi:MULTISPECIES: hypothetical protein [Calothrix]|uniref:Uncharacterized protein n=2 Tax=Calothrix TaxID=1186 RepID=A0ABR8A2Z3_9CYAN|nr:MULTISPECIES: hypothetical protein [Calothrix]MBD2194251.1 hypothetical protein [Calothrix parietina FACHB-288]MBD2225047.1 hypothetical protein [Calothrix anomala FACHB-343]